MQERFAESSDLREWAASTFDPQMFQALPAVLNKKHYVKLTLEETVEVLLKMHAQLEALLDMKRRA